MHETVRETAERDGLPMAFLICTEPGRLERLSRLLVRSLRRWGGRLRDAPVFSFAPRPGLDVSPETLAEFERLGVVHESRPLNVSHPDYPLANKVEVCAHAEREIEAEILVFADSDIVFWNAPERLCLPPEVDVALRPEQKRWVGAGSPEHEGFPYWLALFERHGIESPPMHRTAVEGDRIFAYWNSGLVSARRRCGVFAKWREVFEANWRESLWPKQGDYYFYCEQVSFTIALLASGVRHRDLPRSYNYNVPLQDALPEHERLECLDEMVVMHYHKLLEKSHWRDPWSRLAWTPPPCERDAWLREQMRELDIGRRQKRSARISRWLRGLSAAS